MWIKRLRFTVAVVLILGLALALPCSDAFAGGGRYDYSNYGGRHGGGGHGGYGGWSRGGYGWGALGGVLIGAAIIAAACQPVYNPVYVIGNPYPYYVSNGMYYQRDIYGNYYVAPSPVVYQPPVVVQQPVYVQQPVAAE